MIAITAIAIALGAFFDAAMDTLQFAFQFSRFFTWNKFFWDPHYSWQNKWKAGPTPGSVYAGTERFFGSSTFLVWLTDGWHLMKFCRNTCVCIAIVAFPLSLPISWVMLVYFLVFRAVWGLSFTASYKILDKK